MADRNGRPKFVTRLSSTVKDKLQAQADEWDMTLTGYINHILWEHVRELDAKKNKPQVVEAPKFRAFGN